MFPTTWFSEYSCGVCKKLCNAHRHIFLKKASPNLNLKLKIYHFDVAKQQQKKLLTHVRISEEITLQELNYKLYAVIVHSGHSIEYGHYYAYAVNDSNEWFKFDDSHVSRSSLE